MFSAIHAEFVFTASSRSLMVDYWEYGATEVLAYIISLLPSILLKSISKGWWQQFIFFKYIVFKYIVIRLTKIFSTACKMTFNWHVYNDKNIIVSKLWTGWKFWKIDIKPFKIRSWTASATCHRSSRSTKTSLFSIFSFFFLLKFDFLWWLRVRKWKICA